MQDTHLRVENITKMFGKFIAVQDISFEAKRGEFISILGPSGCGKTTILRIIAGLETQNSGSVLINGKDVSLLPVSKRNVGIVFQSYALFPNLTAEQNIAYGFKKRRKLRLQIKKRVNELIQLVGLEGMEKKYPSQLSGGQQQRVALARAMALSPDILLLDEPLSALDAKVRVMLRSEIRELQKRLGITTIMVTHDQEEALTMADQILVMDQGRLAQNGSPSEIYDRPANPFVASFIGSMNFIDGAVKTNRGIYHLGSQRLHVANENGSRDLESGKAVTIAIRPEDIFISQKPDGNPNMMTTWIESMEYHGPLFRLGLRLADDRNSPPLFEADVSSEKVRRLNLKPDMKIHVRFPEDRLRVYHNMPGNGK